MRRRLAFAAWTLVASLVLLEGVLQLGALFFRAAPADLDASVDPQALRVLAVGDSWVEGAEAPEGEGFVDHVGRELGAVVGRPVQMFNLGRTGANSAHAALTVLDEAERIRPALILVLVGQNNASNFYRVAEVEQRLGAQGASMSLLDRSKVVKLGRILAANARGGSGYRGGEARAIAVPELVLDDQGHPEVTDPQLGSGPGLAYLRRDEGTPAEPSWRVLHAASRRDFAVGARDAFALVQSFGWPTADANPSAPTASSAEEALARYALLRLAREQRNWRAVRYHGGALIDFEPRGALVDLGSAEAHLLAGDWRSARALLLSAHHRAPGLPDAIDLAGRFPDQARDPDVFEVLEHPPAGRLLPHEEARMLVEVFDPRAAEDLTRVWLDRQPGDRPLRADLARTLIANGRHDEARSLMDAGGRPWAPPEPDDADGWRVHVALAGETGDRDAALAAVDAALAAVSAPDAALLQALAVTRAAYGDCAGARPLADRWFQARGDGNGYAVILQPCLVAGDAADRLASLRASWGPLGQREAWTALVRAGHKPFDLLYRDLDLIVAEADRIGAEVLLVNYPNPSEDHTALRDILGDYAATRPVAYVDLWAEFADRHDAAAWADRLGPNGHCNAAGYREMADGILAHAARTGLLAGAAP